MSRATKKYRLFAEVKKFEVTVEKVELLITADSEAAARELAYEMVDYEQGEYDEIVDWTPKLQMEFCKDITLEVYEETDEEVH